MKKAIHVNLLGLLILIAFSACEQMSGQDRGETGVPTTTEPVESRVEEQQPATLQEALQADAQLARTMSLDEFVRHMQTREEYYSQFGELSYEDDFVTINRIGNELKVEKAAGSSVLKDSTDATKAATVKP